MSLADELLKLQQLRESGALSEQEFQKAKKRLLDGEPPPKPAASSSYNELDRSLGQAANRYVSYTGISSVIGGIAFIIVLLFIVFGACSTMDRGVHYPLGDLCDQPDVTCTK